jgi:hypothetical protein
MSMVPYVTTDTFTGWESRLNDPQCITVYSPPSFNQDSLTMKCNLLATAFSLEGRSRISVLGNYVVRRGPGSPLKKGEVAESKTMFAES